MNANSTATAIAEAMNLLMIIDKELVKRHYPNPSEDPGNPRGIDHANHFLSIQTLMS